MASSICLRRSGSAANLLANKFLHPLRSVAVAPSTTRSFTSNALRESDDDERNLDSFRRPEAGVGRRAFPCSLFSGNVFDPFSPTRSLSQVLNMMDELIDSPLGATSRGMGGGLKRGWDAKEDNDALHLKIDMPGLGKEDVNVAVEQNTLIIKGEGEDEESGRRYSSRIDLPPKVYKIDTIKAEMKNGVLKISVPKVKEEERKEVLRVNVE